MKPDMWNIQHRLVCMINIAGICLKNISEKDLSLRGAGELLGNKQSGITPFSYVNIIDDFKMLQVSLSDAKYIIDNASYPDFKKIIVKASTIIDENKKI